MNYKPLKIIKHPQVHVCNKNVKTITSGMTGMLLPTECWQQTGDGESWRACRSWNSHVKIESGKDHHLMLKSRENIEPVEEEICTVLVFSHMLFVVVREKLYSNFTVQKLDNTLIRWSKWTHHQRDTVDHPLWYWEGLVSLAVFWLLWDQNLIVRHMTQTQSGECSIKIYN